MARDNRKNVFLTMDEAKAAYEAIGYTMSAHADDRHRQGLEAVHECLDGLLNGFDAMVIGDPYADLPKAEGK